MAGPLRGDLQAVRRGEADDLGDVPLVLGHGDRRGLLREGEVEGQRRGVPARLTGLDHRAADTSSEALEGAAGLDCGHGGSSSQ